MFRFYPTIEYQSDDYDSITAIDITSRIKIDAYVKRTSVVSSRTYFIRDQELPEHISTNLYGKPTYAYTILLVNEIHNLYEEWPRSNKEFIKYINDKYGSVSQAKAQTKYWYDSNGISMDENIWITLDDSKKYKFSAYEYEEHLNDKKREIKVLIPSIIPKIETGIQEILNSSGN